MTQDTIRHLVYNYGSEVPHVQKYAKEKKVWGELIPGSKEATKGEVIHAVREEMAQKLSDVILRRMDLGSGEYPGDEAVQACSELMAGESGWDRKRIKQETQEVQNLYKTRDK
jgi:glycerol-3-phosphate dehydrogenase